MRSLYGSAQASTSLSILAVTVPLTLVPAIRTGCRTNHHKLLLFSILPYPLGSFSGNEMAGRARRDIRSWPVREVMMPPPLRHYRFSGRLNQKKNPAVWVAASNERSNLQGLAIGLRPILIGSRGSSSRVASAVTNAAPLMEGTMRPWSRRTVASNRLPIMLSCRQVCPGPKRPSATRHATLAEVPVPQGERS